MKKVWPFSFNFLIFGANAFIAPFIVLYYQELDFTGTQIGLLTGIIPLITLVSAPLFTGLADATRRHRLMMSLCILGVIITVAAFPQLNTFLEVLITISLFFVFFPPIIPFADSATMFMLTDEKEMYSRIRLGASIGFGTAAFISGLLVQNYGLKSAFWGAAALNFLALLSSQKLVYGQSEADNPKKGRARTLLTNPRWVLFLVIAFVNGLGMTAYNNYLFPFMKDLGANESTMGLALTVGMISEIPILFFGNRLIKYLKPFGLLMLATTITGARMLLFAASGTASLILIIQLLNGLTFSAMWVAGVTYADKHAPAGMSATAQGLFSAMVSGVGLAVGGFTGGLLLDMAGGRGIFLVFGSVVLAVVPIVILIQRRLPGEKEIALEAVGD